MSEQIALDFDYRIEANEYGFYCVPTDYSGREIADLLAAGEVYEPKTLRLFRRLITKGDVVSGGTFIGDFLPALRPAASNDNYAQDFAPEPFFDSNEEVPF